MIRMLHPPLLALIERGEPLRIVDAGCGLSYLTLSLAWCFRHVFRHLLCAYDADVAVLVRRIGARVQKALKKAGKWWDQHDATNAGEELGREQQTMLALASGAVTGRARFPARGGIRERARAVSASCPKTIAR